MEDHVTPIDYLNYKSETAATGKRAVFEISAFAKFLKLMTAPVYENAVAHGWHDSPRCDGEVFSLFHAELSEALEEYRNDNPLAYVIRTENGEEKLITDMAEWKPHEKPEGVVVELADFIIRVLDWFGSGRSLHDDEVLRHLENGEFYYYARHASSPYGFGRFIADLHMLVSLSYEQIAELANEYEYLLSDDADWQRASRDFFSCDGVIRAIGEIFGYSIDNGVDLFEVIRRKHEYNKTRTYRHGGKKI